ncbi:MAG TPA: Gfo/Idh/MocA family oxidoreductase [Vicinamibacterales bacterium]|nr:Gfo/Idh/MocA family oxidoreductase [Vicinamibacterales bacterium]
MSRRWRVAILGPGHWYSAYGLARSLREYPRAELVAAAWTNARQLDEFTQTFSIRGYADYGELLARESVDIVQIAAPVVDIPGLTVESARAGKHIIVGKPIAMV